jgi:hypothetical protein
MCQAKTRPFFPLAPRPCEASLEALDRRSGQEKVAAFMGVDANRARPGRQRL